MTNNDKYMIEIVEKFCTPPDLPISGFDQKTVAEIESVTIPFTNEKDEKITCYVMGKGKTVVLAHGWGSRATHMIFIARALVNNGFRVIMFDAPAHSSIVTIGLKTKSNMFEFCRALSDVVQYFSPVYGIVGHSLGALSAVFTSAGHKALSSFKINAEKLVFISLPESLDVVIDGFCKQHNLDENDFNKLRTNLEKDFNFSVDDYYVPSATNNINGDILLIHDEDDDLVPVDSLHTISGSLPKAKVYITKGFGHQKILINRKMIAKIVEFLE